MSSSKSRERVARNFVERYGASRLQRLIEALSNAESGQAIAEEFDVSRERVRQWKNSFGQVLTLYQVHPEVQRVLDDISTSVQALPEGTSAETDPDDDPDGAQAAIEEALAAALGLGRPR